MLYPRSKPNKGENSGTGIVCDHKVHRSRLGRTTGNNAAINASDVAEIIPSKRPRRILPPVWRELLINVVKLLDKNNNRVVGRGKKRSYCGKMP